MTPEVYYEDEKIKIRSMAESDVRVLFDTYDSYGWEPSKNTFEGYLREQEEGRRTVFIAEYENSVAGICTLVRFPKEGPWAGRGWTEIEDLTVFYPLHGKGIGTKLMDAAEREAAKIADHVYLAVGVHVGYGPAQKMYVKRGYVPDGSGVWYNGKPLGQYAPCRNDDGLLLYMSKSLGNAGGGEKTEEDRMTFRKLTPDDREAVTALFKDVFTNEPWNDDWSDAAQLDAYILDLTGQCNSLALGCFIGGRLAGLSMGPVRHWHAGTEYCIEEFCIGRQWQGRGIGTRFMREIEAYLVRNGIYRIFLQTDRHVPAYDFYAHRGFLELKDHVSFAKELSGEQALRQSGSCAGKEK